LTPLELGCAAAQQLKMLSQSRVLVVDAGRSVETPCEFHCAEFSMFENPVIWKKIQADEQTSINIMGNILDPFLDTQRFEVVLVSDHPRYQMSLRISSTYLSIYLSTDTAGIVCAAGSV